MFIVRTIFVKPAGIKWYRAAPGVTETLAQWGAAQFAAGAYTKARSRKVGKNKVISTMVFADQAAYETWRTACDAHPETSLKNTYFEANGITKVVKKFQMVD
jgi:hypothetical protein